MFLFQYLRSPPRKRILAKYAFKSFDYLQTVPGSSEGWLLLKEGKLGVKVSPDPDTANAARGTSREPSQERKTLEPKTGQD